MSKLSQPALSPSGRRTTTRRAVTDTSIDTPVTDRVPLRAPDPAVVAARLMLITALDQGRHWPATSAEGACIVVRTPGPEWVDPVRLAWRAGVSERLLPEDEVDSWPGQVRRLGPDNGWVVITGSHPWSHVEEVVLDLERAAWTGQPTLGISQDPERCLPGDLLLRANLVLRLTPLTRDQLRATVAEVTDQPCRGRVTATLSGRITPRQLRMARRIGQSSTDYLRQLVRMSGGQEGSHPSQPLHDPSPLALLHGVEEAVAWGRSLARDVALYRAGKLAWSEVDPGVLFWGVPGTGKTTLARAIALNAGLPFIATSYADWQAKGEGYLGDVVRAVKETFAMARDQAPCMLFVDELDSLSSRSAEGATHREWWVVINNLILAELDGIGGRPGVVVVGATNWPGRLDAALLRAGRLDRSIEVPLPDAAAFQGILRDLVGRDLPNADLDPVALALVGRSGADAGQVVRGARRRAREAGRPLSRDDLMLGAGVHAAAMPPEEALRRAAHEAGHVVLAELVAPGSVPAANLRAGRPWEAAAERAAGLGDMLQVLLAGRAGEELLTGTPSGAAGGDGTSDLALATVVVLDGITAGGAGPGLAWLGEVDAARATDLLARRPDLAELVNAQLAASYAAALARLREHGRAVAAVADGLLPGRLLTGAQLRSVMREAGVGSSGATERRGRRLLH